MGLKTLQRERGGPPFERRAEWALKKGLINLSTAPIGPLGIFFTPLSEWEEEAEEEGEEAGEGGGGGAGAWGRLEGENKEKEKERERKKRERGSGLHLFYLETRLIQPLHV